MTLSLLISRRTIPLLLAVLLVLLLGGTACSCRDLAEAFNEAAADNLLDDLIPGSDDPSDSSASDDDAMDEDDDDASPVADDDNDNDDNDDTSPDSDDDDDNDDTVTTAANEIVDGGLPGADGTALVRLADDSLLAAAAKENRVYLYSITGQTVAREELFLNATAPALAVAAGGAVHLAYVSPGEPAVLHYARRLDGEWYDEGIGSAADHTRPSLVVDDRHAAHLSYLDGAERLVYAVDTGEEWSVQIVDEREGIEAFSSLALDSAGAPRLAYTRYDRLLVAGLTDGVWENEQVAESGEVGSLSFDATSREVLVYHDPAALDLKLARRTDAGWTSETIDAGPNVGGYASQCVNDRGDRFVAYYDDGNEALRLATDRDGAWSTTVIASGNDLGKYTAVTPDATGEPAIVFYAEEGLGLAETVDGEGNLRWLDGGGIVGLYASLAVDGDGEPHIAYFDLTHQRLKYARRRGVAWDLQVVDQSADTGYYPSLAVDADGYAHIAYYNRDDGDLMYAGNVLGAWVSLVVAEEGDVGFHPSLALNDAGRAFVSYYDSSGGGLQLADNAFGNWRIEDLEDGGDTGFYSALGLAGDGAVHLAYLDRACDCLRHATGNNGHWLIETVDAADEPGSYVDLYLDARERLHLAYRAALTGELRYAVREETDGEWLVETVAAPGVFYDPSLVVADNDEVQILFFQSEPAQMVLVWGGPGMWQETTLDAGASVSGYTSLAVDTAGWLHAAYAGAASLKYALFRSGGESAP